MKYVDEFRSAHLAQKIAHKISAIMPSGEIRLMEVCGTHTQSFCRFGLSKLLPCGLKLISGPGCPVCVTTQEYLAEAIGLSRDKEAIILTFGDMLNIPAGKNRSLEQARGKFADVRIVYSPLDCLQIAGQNPGKKIVFLAVGFETTCAGIALTIQLAQRQKLKNLFFYSSLKLIPPVMAYLAQDKRLKLHGFLCPGHVSAIIGTLPYEFIAKRYRLPCCVAGFEPIDILEGIYLLLRQIVNRQAKVENQYQGVVTKQGNRQAKKIISEVFSVCTASWRGLGEIPQSGLRMKKEFAQFDAGKVFLLSDRRLAISDKPNNCRCGDILKGLISPQECPLFARSCRPDNPQGPCMVSREGACNAYYKYHL